MSESGHRASKVPGEITGTAISRAPLPAVAVASISCATRAPDSSAPSIEVESRDVCSPAKWILPSGREITGRNSKTCPGANEA